jgi:hypothetical protein
MEMLIGGWILDPRLLQESWVRMQFVGVLWNIPVVLWQLDCDEYCKNKSEFLL